MSIEKFFNDAAHRVSEEQAYYGETLLEKDPSAAFRAFESAATMEEQAARKVPLEESKVRTVLAISAGSLWIKSQKYSEAVRCAKFFLFDLAGLTHDGQTFFNEILKKYSEIHQQKVDYSDAASGIENALRILFTCFLNTGVFDDFLRSHTPARKNIKADYEIGSVIVLMKQPELYKLLQHYAENNPIAKTIMTDANERIVKIFGLPDVSINEFSSRSRRDRRTRGLNPLASILGERYKSLTLFGLPKNPKKTFVEYAKIQIAKAHEARKGSKDLQSRTLREHLKTAQKTKHGFFRNLSMIHHKYQFLSRYMNMEAEMEVAYNECDVFDIMEA